MPPDGRLSLAAHANIFSKHCAPSVVTVRIHPKPVSGRIMFYIFLGFWETSALQPQIYSIFFLEIGFSNTFSSLSANADSPFDYFADWYQYGQQRKFSYLASRETQLPQLYGHALSRFPCIRFCHSAYRTSIGNRLGVVSFHREDAATLLRYHEPNSAHLCKCTLPLWYSLVNAPHNSLFLV